MRLLTLLLLIHNGSAQFFNIDDCVIDYRSLENMWDQKLVHDLHTCYETYKAPPQNVSEPLKIKVTFTLKSFKFISEEQKFATYMWATLVWQDDRLKWDPSKYDGINKVASSNSHLWTPELRLINSQIDFLEDRYMYIPCEIENSGLVQCVVWADYEATCVTDLRDWPFDAQNCKLEFGFHQETGRNNKLQLFVTGRAVRMIAAEYGAEWDIMDYEQKLNHSSEAQLTMKFRLERHADILAAIVIYPSLILTILTVTCLFVDARRKLRLFLLCFSLMCHFDFLSQISYDIPKHSKESPRLLYYYRGSFIMTSILVCMSFALNLFCRSTMVCPKWILCINDLIYTKFGRFVIWPRWETKDVNEDLKSSTLAWTDFANAINSIWIAISIIVYGIMYSVFVPHPIPIVF